MSYTDGKRYERYKLIDPFCRFFLQFMDKKQALSNYWQTRSNSSQVASWRGYAFEEVCFSHINQIRHALGISGVSTEVAKWVVQGNDEQQGSQIDMLLDRADNIVNICEIKFSNGPYVITKQYDLALRERIQILSSYLPKRKMPHLTFVTSFGVKHNEYAGVVQSEVTMDDLFKE